MVLVITMNILSIFYIGIFLLFPVLLYLALLIPINNFSLEKNKLSFSLCLFLSLLLLFIYQKTPALESIFFYVPIIISCLLKRNTTAFYLSLFTIIYLHDLALLPFLLVLLELVSYFLIEKFFSKSKNYKKLFITYVLLIKLLLLLFFKVHFFSIFTILLFFAIYLNLILNILKKSEFLTDLSFKVKELEKEKRLKTSIFKLTHELKNPLAVCNGYLEMMDLSNESKTKRYFTILKDEIKRSLNIINDFSSFGKIKKIEKEELDVYYLLDEIKETLRPLFINNCAEIIIDDDKDIYFEGDYSRLKQVFINLLKNALEAKKNKETISISIKAKELKEKVKIVIKDNGCGMTKDELEHIGDVFYTTKENGSGLGLSYCREIIELHGGNINFKSIKDKGTTVTLYFPKFQRN